MEWCVAAFVPPVRICPQHDKIRQHGHMALSTGQEEGSLASIVGLIDISTLIYQAVGSLDQVSPGKGR